MRDVDIGPMDRAFILYRCLHGGPLTGDTIGRMNPGDNREWWEEMQHQDRFGINARFLSRVVRTYGSCAMLAWDGDSVVGYVRFFPQALLREMGVSSLCMQQKPPYGVSVEMVEADFPSPEESRKAGLKINCMMTGSPSQKSNPYQRRGIGSAMIGELIGWARSEGWSSIEAVAFNDLPAIYEITGQAGKRFWEKLGFRESSRKVNPDLTGGFLDLLEKQAVRHGLPGEDARMEYCMRIDLI